MLVAHVSNIDKVLSFLSVWPSNIWLNNNTKKYVNAATYLKDGDSSPEYIVKMFPVTHALRVTIHDFVTITLSGSICEHAKLTAKEVHT